MYPILFPPHKNYHHGVKFVIDYNYFLVMSAADEMRSTIQQDCMKNVI